MVTPLLKNHVLTALGLPIISKEGDYGNMEQQRYRKVWHPISIATFSGLAAYGVAQIALHFKLGWLLAIALGFVAFIWNFLNSDWPQPSDLG
jgi:hypothetical protein